MTLLIITSLIALVLSIVCARLSWRDLRKYPVHRSQPLLAAVTDEHLLARGQGEWPRRRGWPDPRSTQMTIVRSNAYADLAKHTAMNLRDAAVITGAVGGAALGVTLPGIADLQREFSVFVERQFETPVGLLANYRRYGLIVGALFVYILPFGLIFLAVMLSRLTTKYLTMEKFYRSTAYASVTSPSQPRPPRDLPLKATNRPIVPFIAVTVAVISKVLVHAMLRPERPRRVKQKPD